MSDHLQAQMHEATMARRIREGFESSEQVEAVIL